MPPSLFSRHKQKKSSKRGRSKKQQQAQVPTKSVEFSTAQVHHDVDRPPSIITADYENYNDHDVSPLKTTTTNDKATATTTPQSVTTASTSSTSSSTSIFPGRTTTIPPRPSQSRWDEDDFLKVVHVWDLSQLEIDKMRDLESKLSDLSHWKNNPFEVVRFLKGPAGHKPAERLFRKMVQWRLENDVDNILQDYTPPPVLLDYCPSAILHGLDCDGDPIYLERAGATDASGLLKRFGHEALIHHVIWLRELCGRGAWIEDHEERMGRPITQVTIVYDLAGLNTRHMRPGVLPFFADMMSLTQSYYTGPVKRMIIIRAPALFRAVWSVVKHVFPEEARAKMVFTGAHNHEEILRQYMDLSVLPSVISPEHGQGYAAEGMPQRFEGGIPPSYDYQEPVSVRPDKLKKMISTTMTETTTASSVYGEDDLSSSLWFHNGDNNNDNHSNDGRQDQIPDSKALLEEVYGSSNRSARPENVTVSTSTLGSGFFEMSHDGEIVSTIQPFA